MKSKTEYQKVTCEETHDGRRLRIVLRGGRGNVIDTAMAAELADAVTERTDGRHLRCVTIEAEGENFSFGASVPEHSGEKVRPLLEHLDRAVCAILHVNVPVIAAVRGNCLGGGLELVLPCHRIVAAPTARLGQPEIVLGMFAPAGSVLLPERVGRGLAEDMLLTGRVLPALEARAAGLVDEIAESPEDAAVLWFEKHLLGKSATALRFATKAARATLIRRIGSTLVQLETLFIEEATKTRDAHEGVASFVEKRAPTWVDA
jgi:cyclohexa-1,5-dienecarbonyl-CoA hydratase